MIVGLREIQRRDVKGTFRRFTYTNNGHLCYVYCHLWTDFLRLVAWWKRLSKSQCFRRYDFQVPDLSFEGDEIALEEIPKDQNFKVKVLLYSQGVEYIQ